MTVPVQSARKIISGTGWENPLTHSFMLENTTHLEVWADSTRLILGADYTISGVGDSGGYSVTINNPAAWAPDNWVLNVRYPISQPNDLDLGGQFGIRFEQALDRVVRGMQTINDDVGRAIKVANDTPVANVYEIELPIGGNLIGWNADGTKLINRGELPDIEAFMEDAAVVASLEEEIEIVAGLALEIPAVTAIAAAITVVAGSISAVTLTAANIAAITGAPAIAEAIALDAASVEANRITVQNDKVIAALAADNAVAAQVAAEAALAGITGGLTDFVDNFLGAFATDPVDDPREDPAGPLESGMLYFNTATNEMMVYTGTAWVSLSSTSGAALTANNGLDYNAASFRLNLDLYSTSQVDAVAAAAPKTALNATAKGTPVDADRIYLGDSTATFNPVYATLTQFKAFLKSYFDGIYQTAAQVSTAISGALTAAIGTTVQPYDAQLSSLIRQNSKSAAYTFALTDVGKHVYHPAADTTARTWTIPANASVAFEIGSAITLVNELGAGNINVAITSDTLILAGSGSTGPRVLAPGGVATLLKVGTNRWFISGAGLT